MVIDHIAYTCVPSNNVAWIIMRIIGRLSAPLFWFCFAENYRRSNDRVRYTLRLMMGSFSMAGGNVVMALFFGRNYTLTAFAPNMFMTMFLMALTIECIERIGQGTKITGCKYLILSILCLFIVSICCEYGFYAACSILIFYFIKRNVIKWILFIIINVALSILSGTYLQMFSLLTILFIMNYDDTKPKHRMKWFFYWFYPMHLWTLMILGHFIN
jgi:hypothetical protein